MSTRGRDLGVLLRSILASLGPDAASMSVTKLAEVWTMVRISVSDDTSLRALAADLGLEQARIERMGRVWWRQVWSKEDDVLVLAAGPDHDRDEEPAPSEVW